MSLQNVQKRQVTMFVHKKNLYRLFPLLLLIFLDSFSFLVVIPVLLKLFYHNHFGLLNAATTTNTRNILTGITISLSMLAALFAAPLIGRLSDIYGRKNTLILCTCAIALGFIISLIGISEKSIIAILLGRLCSGIGSASQPVAQAAVADLCDQNEKPFFLSLIAVMMTLALIIAPLAGGFLTEPHISHFFTIETPFIFALGLSVINLILIIFSFIETKKLTQKSEIFSIYHVMTELPNLIKRYRFGSLIVLFTALELCWSQYYQFVPLYLQLKFQYSTDIISTFSAVMGIVMAAGLLIIYPFLLALLEVGKILKYSLLLILVGLFSCIIFPIPIIHWLSASIIALSTGCAYVSLITIISNKVSVNEQGITMGYLSTLLYFSWMLTAFDSGFLTAVHMSAPFYLATGFLLFPLAYFVRCTKQTQTINSGT